MASSEKKVLDIYCEGASQRVKFYPGTPKKDVLELILKLFHKFSETATLKSQCIFYDEDGDPVVFSPDSMPSGTKLHMRVQAVTLNPSSVSTPKSGTASSDHLHWDPDVNSFLQIGYHLTENNTCASHHLTGAKEGHYSMPILCAKQSFKSGKHKWKCSFANQPSPYCAFGLISREEKQQLNKKDFGNDFRQYPLFYKFLTGTKNGSHNEYIFKLNMAARSCVVEWRGTSPGKEVISGLPDEVWPAVTMKRGNTGMMPSHARISFE